MVGIRLRLQRLLMIIGSLLAVISVVILMVLLYTGNGAAVVHLDAKPLPYTYPTPTNLKIEGG